MSCKRQKCDARSLQFLCCEAIANNDLVGEIKEMARVLPMDVIEYLLCKLKMEQFVQFHQLFPAGAPEERLFRKKYVENSRFRCLCSHYTATDKHMLGYKSEFEQSCAFYWTHKVEDIMRWEGKNQGLELATLSPKIAQYVKKMHFYGRLKLATTMDQLSGFSNIERIVCGTSHLKKLDKIFKFAGTCKYLRKLEFSGIQCNAKLLQRLKQFLQYKADRHESVLLKFSQLDYFLWDSRTWIFTLGEAIHGIAGISIQQKHIFPADGQKWLQHYSQARHIDALVLHRVQNVSTLLSDITKNAPSQNDASPLLKLHLRYIRLELQSLPSLQHWRFSRIKQFRMRSVPFGYKGAIALAEHATFWPFVHTVQLISCHITSNGLLRLLPAMVHRDGCQHLEVFNISLNKIQKQGLHHIGHFLQSPNIKKLKLFSMSQAKFHKNDAATSFINSLRSTHFIKLDLSSEFIPSSTHENILQAIFSKPNPQLQKLIVSNSIYESNSLQELAQKYLKI